MTVSNVYHGFDIYYKPRVKKVQVSIHVINGGDNSPYSLKIQLSQHIIKYLIWYPFCRLSIRSLSYTESWVGGLVDGG